jgi:hypothetical protein
MATGLGVWWRRGLCAGLVLLGAVASVTVFGSFLAGAAAASVLMPGGSYVSLTPARIADTRSGVGGVPVGATAALAVATAGHAGVPATGVSAVAVNITVTGPSAAGSLTAYATGTAKPGTSNGNFGRGQTVAQLAVVSVSPAGQFTISATTKTHLVVDLEGYFTSADTATSRGLFNPLDPARIMDSRRHLGANAPGPGATSVLQVTGRGGVPASGVSAVVVNTTVTAPSAAGYVTAYPTGTARTTSTINFTRGQTVADRAIVPVSADGRISLFNAVGTTQVVIDVSGYFTDGVMNKTGSYYVATSASRIVDTRHWTTSVPSGSATVTSEQIAGNTCVLSPGPSCGQALVPPIAAATRPVAVLLTLTAVPRGQAGYLGAYAAGSPVPSSSDVNFAGVAPVSNLTFVKLAAGGAVSVRDGGGTANVVEDLSGYFALPAVSPTPVGLWLSQDFGGTMSVPARTSPLPNLTAVIPGVGSWTYGLTTDGTVWAWDRVPADPAVGDMTSLHQLDPADLHDISAVSDGQDPSVTGYAYGLRGDGTVWSWGYRPDATGTARFGVFEVPGLSRVVGIGGAQGVGYAIKDDGTVWSWGSNRYGLLGDGTTTSRDAPGQVSGLSGIKSIAGGTTLAYAVDNNGELWGWGAQSPTGVPATTILSPTPISGTCPGQSVFAGRWMNSFELCADGSVWQLDKTRTSNLSKVTGLSAVTSLAASPGPGPLVLEADGTVWHLLMDGSWAATPGLTGIHAIAGDNQFTYAIAAG